MLWIVLGASETLSVPDGLNWPARLNWTVSASIQVRLVACTGEAGVDGRSGEDQVGRRDVRRIDVARERDGDRRGRRGERSRSLQRRSVRPATGTSEVVTTRNAPPIGLPPVPSNSKAPMSRGP